MKHRFSAMWSEQLGKAIRTLAPTIYPMDLTFYDASVVKEAVSQGIDAHLEACFMPHRGDSYVVTGNRLACKVSNESLPVLVRRLLESPDDHAMSLASSICQTLGIELI